MPRKVLIVRFSSIGDIVLCSPIVRAFKLQLGDTVHFITKEKFKTVVSANPHIDRIWTFQKDFTECLDELKSIGFDLIIDMHHNLRSKRLQYRLGIKTYVFNKLNIEKFLHIQLAWKQLKGIHIVDRYYEAYAKCGIHDDGHGLDFFYDADVNTLLELYQLTKGSYIAIVLGATYLTKRVPEKLIAELLASDGEQQMVLLGGKDVREIGLRLSQKSDRVVDLCGQIDLQESAGIIDHSQMVISGDTGLLHIAAALKKPIISIWGGTHPILGMYPYYGFNFESREIRLLNEDVGCSPCSKIGKDHCPKKHFDCMQLHTLERLKAAINRQKLAN